jgi:hypothetical protein
MGNLSFAGAALPVYAELFPLCGRGIAKTWTDQGALAVHPADRPMSSLGRTWSGSRAVRRAGCPVPEGLLVDVFKKLVDHLPLLRDGIEFIDLGH